MKVYKVKTLSELILELKLLPAGAFVRGIEAPAFIHSDRGYYERNALVPTSDATQRAHSLASFLEEQIGETMYGWKGGEYVISGAKPVAFAAEGDTGPYIAGFALLGDVPNLYGPVLIYSAGW